MLSKAELPNGAPSIGLTYSHVEVPECSVQQGMNWSKQDMPSEVLDLLLQWLPIFLFQLQGKV